MHRAPWGKCYSIPAEKTMAKLPHPDDNCLEASPFRLTEAQGADTVHAKLVVNTPMRYHLEDFMTIKRRLVWMLWVLLGMVASALAEPQAGERRLFDGMAFVWVPGGTFQMGCGPWTDECTEAWEKPVHEVTLSGFWLGEREVTQGEWRAVMGLNPSSFSSCGDDCPVEQVSWEDAQRFIQKLNARGEGMYRLPTEAEWEYGCRSAGKAEKYAGGGDLEGRAWYHKNSNRTPHPVGRRVANGLGLLDMSGNLYEWVYDGFAAYPDQAQ
ncbi:MAG: formylglycine-generating enzyme family protein, partial [Magnetococcales bacterium]|nr:formylglycine-generating enzyme family protein [Magnetococcales bacterium]